MTDKKENCGCGCIGQKPTHPKNPKATKDKQKSKKSR